MSSDLQSGGYLIVVLTDEKWFFRQALSMKHLQHCNIVPLYGVSTTVADFCLVSPWYENGNIMEYLKKNPDVGRFGLVSTL